MFLQPLIEFARHSGYTLPHTRERYLPFKFYPLREHATLLLATAEAAYPNQPVRQGLRKLGRAGPQALLRSTIGRVVLGSAEGVHAMVAAMMTSYPINLKPCSASVLSRDEHSITVRLQDVHYFLDSHHIGVFEGLLRHAGVEGSVRIATRSSSDAEFLLTFG